MKDETEMFAKGIREEIDKLHKFGNLSLPISLVNSFIRKTRIYSTEDVRDIIANYDRISSARFSPSLIGYAIRLVMFSTSKMARKTKIFDDLGSRLELLDAVSPEDEILYEELTCVARFSKFNFNLANVDNVYLHNFEFLKRYSFEAVEFDISDIEGSALKGVFVYKHPFYEDESEKRDIAAQKELELVLMSDGKTAFDLDYTAMDERFQLKRNGLYIPRGKKILVDHINKLGSGYKKRYSPSGSFIPAPILERIWR